MFLCPSVTAELFFWWRRPSKTDILKHEIWTKQISS